ncbi:MAG TPA: ParA family protein [Vicinamibacterales bacterium]|nr:ParA family protein [Vicinamibacterales bacterium]
MIIAFFNPKGGSGKTTTAVNVAAVLARSGRRVLLVDLEVDLNASISLGLDPSRGRPSIFEVLLRDERAPEAVREVTSVPNLFLVSGSRALTRLDAALRNVRQPERRLADAIRPLASQFDVIVLDSPAGYSLMAQSVPLAADHLVVPMRAHYLALESLAQFLRWYHDQRIARRATADMAGVLLTMVDYRLQATREIIEIIRAHNGRGVLRTEIPLDPRAAEAPSHGIALVDYAPRTRASQAYQRLARELLQRLTAPRRR